PFLAELHYDNAGTDAGEFVEVQVPAGTSTAGWTVVLYNGSGGASYSTRALPAVAATTGAPSVAVLDYAPDGIQNGSPDGVALADPAGVVAEFLSYEGVFTAVGGPAAGLTGTDTGVAETSTTPVGSSLSRSYQAATDSYVWRSPAAATKGAVNPGGPGTGGPVEPPPAQPCDTAPTQEIGAVQGGGPTTPLPGQRVNVRGTVVGDLPGLSGSHLQDADGDGDAATSDGVFVSSTVPVALGDVVAVTGTASESFGQTQIAADQAQTCTGGTLPMAVPLDLPADDAARERFEGMLVIPSDTLTVSEVFALTRFGELLLSEGGLLVQPTELERPGPAAVAAAEQNAGRRIVLDDGLNARTSVTSRPYLGPTTPVRVGDPLTFTEPLVLGFGFGAWRLQPADGTADGVFAQTNTRPATPDEVGGDITVGAFNVLNYFLTLGGVGRGARTEQALEQQAAKIVTAIQTLDADVVALQEIEDSDATALTPGDADTALADLVRRLNEAAGYQEWAFPAFPAELLAGGRGVTR
ncbi:MAG: endonuclease, partial [Pseudorhodobacter sp.]|nr:endonuclease [Frankiaceae bacterium]